MLKKERKYGKYTIRIAAIALTAVILWLGASVFYSNSKVIDAQLFEASSQSLEETYSEVVLVFDELTSSRWNYLTQIGHFLEYTDSIDESKIADYVYELKEKYGFTELYLLNDAGGYRTVDGSTGYIDFGENLFKLIDDGENIVTDGSLPGRENMFFYVVPATPGTYQEFPYCAVAFGYNKQDLADVLQVDIYEGASDSYLVYPNGRVCITMGDVTYDIRNILSTISDWGGTDDVLKTLTEDLQNGTTNTLTVVMDGVEYYISYQTTNLSDWRFLSLTPVSVVDQHLNDVRSATANMMFVMFTAIVVLLVLVFLYWLWKANADKKSLLAERELIFRVMSEHMNEIYFLYHEPSRRMRYISPNVERMLGLSMREVYENESAINKCVCDTDAWDDHTYLQSMKPGDSIHREYDMINLVTGEKRPYVLDLYRPSDEHQEMLVGSLTDNSEEYKIRESIISALETARTANAAKSTFLSSMSHDIRTPMNAILGFTTLLERDANDSALVLAHTVKIRSSGMHLLELINDVLDMSKIESGNTVLDTKAVRIEEIAEEITDLIRPLADEKGQHFTLHMDFPKEEIVLADKLRLMQVLQNLLSNAVKYTPDGGDIEFGIIRMTQKQEGSFEKYLFVIKDNGIGMSKEFLERIFDPFSREVKSTVNKVQGTGLGMAITKNLVDLMGGTIHVTSKPDEGSTFEVLLDFHIEKSSEEESGQAHTLQEFLGVGDVIDANVDCGHDDSGHDEYGRQDGQRHPKEGHAHDRGDSMAPQDTSPLRGKHILAAEDNELNAEILTELLKMEGVTCDIATNGQEAVEMFEQEAEKGIHYDFILMDVQMPIMNGYTATGEIRKSKKNPRGATVLIVAMTANAFGEDVQNALNAGMDAHLAKPMNMGDLRDTIERLSENRRG